MRRFTELLAQFMPFDLVIDEETADGQQARVSKTSMCGTQGAIAGPLRYFADRFGVPRASIEGTQIRLDRLRRYARQAPAELVYDAQRGHTPLILKRQTEYFGFVLERESEPLEEFPPELAAQARRALAEALARSKARHAAVKQNHGAIEEVRELYRRSGGQTPQLGFDELASLYEKQLAEQQVNSLREFRDARLTVRVADFVPAEQRKQLHALPTTVFIANRAIEIEYDVEDAPSGRFGVARLRLPEKLAHTLTPGELPILDRPLRFVVTRGQLGAVRADTLEQLQERLEGPWIPNHMDWNEANDERPAAPKHGSRKPHAPPRKGARSGGFGRSGGRKGRRR